MGSVNDVWTDPTTSLDLPNGATVTETHWDAVMSNLLKLGGTDGSTKTGRHIIDQLTDDLSILKLASTGSVNHGATGIVDTAVYGWLKKQSGVNGGLMVSGIRKDAAYGLTLASYGGVADTGKNAAARGAVEIYAAQYSGTAIADLSADANVLAVKCRRGGADVTVAIIDEDGDILADGSGVTVYDAHDDGLLAGNLASVLAGRPEDATTYDAESLRALKLAHVGPDGRPFVSYKHTQMLLLGAVKQARAALVQERQARKALEERLTALEAKVA